jgi:hypothetical protein
VFDGRRARQSALRSAFVTVHARLVSRFGQVLHAGEVEVVSDDVRRAVHEAARAATTCRAASTYVVGGTQSGARQLASRYQEESSCCRTWSASGGEERRLVRAEP